jgi:hypothetical protein
MGTAVMASKMYPGWDVHLHYVLRGNPNSQPEGTTMTFEPWDFNIGVKVPGTRVLHIIGDGIEIPIIKHTVKPKPDGVPCQGEGCWMCAMHADALDELGIVDLRKLAKPYKIPGAWSMKSAELREAIRAAREQ